MTDDTLTNRLAVLIRAEREALLAGNFDRISDLMDEKQGIMGEIGADDVDAQALTPLRDGLRRNQELYDQALAGLRNVAARLGDLNRARKSTDTYTASGSKMTLRAPEVKRLERRA